jgi:hypothetical protein
MATFLVMITIEDIDEACSAVGPLPSPAGSRLPAG